MESVLHTGMLHGMMPHAAPSKHVALILPWFAVLACQACLVIAPVDC